MSESVLPVLSSRSFIVSLIHFEFFKTFKIGILWQLSGKESACHVGLIPGLGRSLEKENGNPFHDSCLGNPMDLEETSGYSPWGCKKLNTT